MIAVLVSLMNTFRNVGNDKTDGGVKLYVCKSWDVCGTDPRNKTERGQLKKENFVGSAPNREQQKLFAFAKCVNFKVFLLLSPV